jgi:multiple sugar transport system substrate-binding protein
MHTRFARLAALVAALALVATACGGSQSSSPPGGSVSPGGGASQPPAAKVTFRITTWAGEDEAKEFQELVLDKINASQSEYEIVHEAAPADYYTKLQTALAGGTGADFMWLSQEYTAGYASRGALLDLTDLLKSIDTPTAKVEGYFPDVIKTAIYQDKVYGLPWISQPVVLYYNPKLFDAAGIAYPDDTWDWAKFADTAKALTKAPDQYGFAANGWPPVHMFIWQAGGEVITPDLATSPIDSPEAIAGVEFYKSLIFNSSCCPTEDTIAEQGFSEMFKAGKVAMFMGGASDTFESADGVALDIGAAVVPKGPKSRTSFAYTASTVVNAKVKNPELAAKALVALTDGIHHWKIVSPLTDLATAEVVKASFPEKWQAQKSGQIDAIIAATKDMRSFNIVPRHQEWDDLFWREFQDLVYHDKGTVADLAKAARPKLEAVLR